MFPENLSYVVPIVSGVSTLITGVVILLHSKKMPQARALAVFTLILSVWLFGSSYMLAHCSNASYAIFLDRLIYVVVSTIPAVIFHFSSSYCQIHDRKYKVATAYFVSVVFSILAWSDNFISGLNTFSNGCHSQAGILHHIFLLYFISMALVVIKDVFKKYKETSYSIEKRQHQFILLALVSQTIIGTSAFLPAYNINSFSFSFFSGLVTTFILVYAMFRHNLLQLKIVALDIFISFVVVASLLQILMVESTTLKIVNGIVFGLIVILGILVTQNVNEEIKTREKGEKLARYLANANARLRELDRQKTEFVSIASHQLRSPIAAIKGYTSMIIDGSFGKVPNNLNEPLSRILESGQRIGVMVDDFLNVTRIEQGHMVYNLVPQNVYTLVSSVVKELHVVVEKKGLTLSISPDSNKDVQVKADEGKLKQIFSNLIDNAIKYTPKGSITISIVEVVESKKVLIKIKDTGIGIAPEEVQNLFQKFNRASNANDINVLGTGLGLYIVREIMKAHDGWINVESEGIGKGSTFIVELPVCD